MLQAIMAKPCSLVTRARAKFINFFHSYTPLHGDTASRKDDVKPGHDCERWNVCLFVLPPAVLCLSSRGFRLGMFIVLHLEIAAGEEFACTSLLCLALITCQACIAIDSTCQCISKK